MKTYSSTPGTERLKPVNCPVCGRSDGRPDWNCGTFSFLKCAGCGHVYQNPQPEFDDLRQRYQDEYFSYELSNEEAFFKLMVLGLADIRFESYEEDLKRKGTFLDIGCATGRLLAHMQDRGWKVQGVELCRASAEYGMKTRGVPIFIGPLEEAAFARESFSVIHFSHLIEHVPDPRSFLIKVRELLLPEGHAVIVTPNRKGFQARLLGTKWRSCIADHVHLFSPDGLGRLLEETGFNIVKTQTWGGIAKDLAPDFVKIPVDRLAKRFGFGDVMLFHARRSRSQPN